MSVEKYGWDVYIYIYIYFLARTRENSEMFNITLKYFSFF